MRRAERRSSLDLDLFEGAALSQPTVLHVLLVSLKRWKYIGLEASQLYQGVYAFKTILN